jgi:hypothetical protein
MDNADDDVFFGDNYDSRPLEGFLSSDILDELIIRLLRKWSVMASERGWRVCSRRYIPCKKNNREPPSILRRAVMWWLETQFFETSSDQFIPVIVAFTIIDFLISFGNRDIMFASRFTEKLIAFNFGRLYKILYRYKREGYADHMPQ